MSVRRRSKANPCPCYHCGNSGWDHYMICQDVWEQVTPPDVDGTKYSSGFVCFRCCLDRAPRKLYREDFGETPVLVIDDRCDALVWFPRRSDKRSHVVLEFHQLVGGPDNRAIVDALLSEKAWFLDALAGHYTRVYCSDVNHDQAEAEYPYANGGAGHRWGNIKL